MKLTQRCYINDHLNLTIDNVDFRSHYVFEIIIRVINRNLQKQQPKLLSKQ